jgi:hypothetical protein
MRVAGKVKAAAAGSARNRCSARRRRASALRTPCDAPSINVI